MNKALLFISFLALSRHINCERIDIKKPSDQEILDKYAPPQEIVDGLAEHTEFLLKKNDECLKLNCKDKYVHLVWQFDSLPGYYLKRYISRLYGREALMKCIEEKNLTLLTVPPKYYYHVPGTGTELTKQNYWVVAKEVKAGSQRMLITLKEIQQICDLIKHTGYQDIKKSNIIRDTTGRISIIDTEGGFLRKKKAPGLAFARLISRRTFNLNENFTEEALKYLLTQIKKTNPTSRRRYTDVNEVLKKHRKPHLWDFCMFFENLYPEFSIG